MNFVKCSISGIIYNLENIETLLINKNINHEILEFFISLAICNTVFVDNTPQNNINNKNNIYKASSPDEECLVKAAQKIGIELYFKGDNKIILNIFGEKKIYEILNVIDFNSDRKRMSVICKTPTNEIKLYCKGADSVILKRLKRENNESQIIITSNHVREFAIGCFFFYIFNFFYYNIKEGFRTLCIANKILTENDYIKWKTQYHKATISLINRKEMINDIAELIEKEMNILGAVAIEDKLQDGVYDCIESLRKAGIKIWMLTGDKQETAISVGFLSGILQHNYDLIILNEDSKKNLFKKLSEFQSVIYSKKNQKTNWKTKFYNWFTNKQSLNLTFPKSFAIIIDGSTLQHALDIEVRYQFLKFAKISQSVICSRCSPLQKAQLVNLVSERSFLWGDGSITLAIGDGANDVPMVNITIFI